MYLLDFGTMYLLGILVGTEVAFVGEPLVGEPLVGVAFVRIRVEVVIR